MKVYTASLYSNDESYMVGVYETPEAARAAAIEAAGAWPFEQAHWQVDEWELNGQCVACGVYES